MASTSGLSVHSKISNHPGTTSAEVPAIAENLVKSCSNWNGGIGLHNIEVKLFTLAIVQDGERILLGKKKRGFGEGLWFGFGGKVEEGESIVEAASRELEEEAGIRGMDFTKRAVLTFMFDDKPMPWEVHTFHVTEFTGMPRESDEMAPKWFNISEIPYESMYADDPLWLPLFLQGLHIQGFFSFVKLTKMVAYEVRILDTDEFQMEVKQ